MATETATIRVTRETRNLLAEQASERGISLSAMLADLAQDVAREAIFRAERDATRADAGAAAVQAEDREWETTVDDGVD
jgi:predicted kinase